MCHPLDAGRPRNHNSIMPDPLLDVLLRDVIANPGEDGYRLVYADWLEDHRAGCQAEFVRVQVEVAVRERAGCEHVPEYLACPMRHGHCSRWCRPCRRLGELRQRERELLSPRHVWDWLGPGPWGPPGSPLARHRAEGVCRLFHAPNPVGSPDWEVTFRRGFVAEVSLPCDSRAVLPALAALAPLEAVRLADREPLRVTGDHRGVWMWCDDLAGDFAIGRHCLPTDVYRKLAGGIPSAPVGRMREYLSLPEAASALSAALLSQAVDNSLACRA